jgi:hypothetical protein
LSTGRVLENPDNPADVPTADTPVTDAPAASAPPADAPPTPAVVPPTEVRQRVIARIDHWSTTRWFQVSLATLLALAHLFAFVRAANTRLHIPFNTAPGVHLQFIDPMVNALGPQPRQPPHWSRLAVSRFDAQHYIGFALRGLSACPKDPTKASGNNYLACGLGWLPAYGVIGGVVSRITTLEPDIALMLISLVCAIVINLLWISPTMIRKLGRLEAFAVLIAWNCYPGAWNLVVLETEAMVVALALGGFVMLANERWVWSGVLIGACTALRIPTASYAFALGCALLLAAWDRRKSGTPQWWRPLIAVPLCGWGQFLTMLVFQIKLGNWHAFFDARWAFGDHNKLGRLVDITYYMRGFAGQCADMVVLMGSAAVVALTARRLLARFNRVETLFIVVASLATLVISIGGAGDYWGITRYMMLCPLPFLGAGVLARHHRGFLLLWLVLCVAIYWNFELCSYLTQGDPGACPCLGRGELHMPWAS